MDRVKFSEREKEIWLMLNDYLIGLSNSKENMATFPKGEKHRIIGEITYYGTDTIRNKYSDANPVFVKEKFAAYCTYFMEHPAHELERGDTYTHFKDWAKDICNRAKWADLFEMIELENVAGDQGVTKPVSEANSTFLAIEKILRFFTAEENLKNYRLLWQLISKDSKAALCNGSFSEFSKLSFVPFKNLFTCNHRYLDADTISCDIFMELRVVNLWGYCVYLHELRLRNDLADLFETHMNQMLEMLHFDGIGKVDGIDRDISVVHVYENELCYDIENLFEVLGINTTNIYTILPLTKTAYFKAFGNATFVNEEKQWLIREVRSHDFLQHVGYEYPFTWIPVRRSKVEEEE